MDTKSDKGAILSLCFVGRQWGQVNGLSGFSRKRHRAPDSVCSATQAFLHKLCAPELEEAAEVLFQDVRKHFGYKRREISLELGEAGKLDCKDFAIRIRYELDPDDPSQYFCETELEPYGAVNLFKSEAFRSSVGARFDRIRFGIASGLNVELVIDAVEEDESGDLSVDYPSDCSSCEISITGEAARLYIDKTLIELRLGKSVEAAELVAAFHQLGSRFTDVEGFAGALRRMR